MLRLVTEMGVVGIVLAAVLACVTWLWPGSLSTPSRAAWSGLLLGAVVHGGFEVSGLNSAYCTTGHACQAMGLPV